MHQTESMAVSDLVWFLEKLSGLFVEDTRGMAEGTIVNLLREEIPADLCVLAWVEGFSDLRWVSTRQPGSALVPRDRWPAAWVEAMEEDPPGMSVKNHMPDPFHGEFFPWGFSINLGLRSEKIGFLWLARAEGPFDPGTPQVCALVQAVMSPVMYERMQRGRSEQINRITTRAYHESQERFEGMVEDSQDAVINFDRKGRIRYMNRAGAELLGYPDPRQLVGRLLMEFWYHPEELEWFMAQVAREGALRGFEAILTRSDGEEIFCLCSATGRPGEDGALGETTATIKDISSMVRQQKELTLANIRLEEAYRHLQESQARMVHQEKLAAIGQLAAGLAHEINNPLAYIASNLGCLERRLAAPGSGNTEESREILGETREGLDRIRKIIANLLSFSRDDASQAPGPFDLNKAVEESLDLSGSLTRAEVEIRWIPDPLLPLARGMAGHSRQIVLNLVLNAAQALRDMADPPLEPTVEVATGLSGRHAWVRVRDNGPGIREGSEERIFDAFFSTKDSGTGLGLSISRELADRMGGRLELEHGARPGACFLLSLAVWDPDGDALGTNPGPGTGAAPSLDVGGASPA